MEGTKIFLRALRAVYCLLPYILRNKAKFRGFDDQFARLQHWVWKGVFSSVFGRSLQVVQNKFFEPSTSSMRKVDDRGNRKKSREKRKQAQLGVPHSEIQVELD